jgi:FixJ family two-component response regulator
VSELTPRQTDIAALIAEGLSNKAIARELAISPRTVRNHIVRIGARVPGSGPTRWRIMSWYIRQYPEAA